MIYRGVCYTVDIWPEERWDRDIALMKAGAFNIVRIGEFAWTRLEPRAGAYDLGWWKDSCGRFAAAGVRILACTPTAAPPVWLSRAHPETLAQHPDGRRLHTGERRHYCPSSGVFRDRVLGVTRAMAEAVRENPAVIAWQIDNEISLEPIICHCALCAQGFRDWLRRKYATVTALNAAWGNGFWSGQFTAWEEIEPPRCGRLSRVLDYRAFMAERLCDLAHAQADLLRSVKPSWEITSNQWAGILPGMDTAALFDKLDFAACDGYFDYYADTDHYSSVWDFYRNVKRRPFWLVETNAWNDVTTMDDGLSALRPWAYQTIAKGADAQFYFPWRQSVMGEENHPAILDWSGEPSRAYTMLSALNAEIHGLAGHLENLPLPEADVAIFHDYTSASCGLLGDRYYWQNLVRSRTLLGRLGVQVDMLPTESITDLGRYRLVILPQLEYLRPGLAETIESYVKDGGVILAQTRLSTIDANGKYLIAPHPSGMESLFALTVVERVPIQGDTAKRHRVLPSEKPLPHTVCVEMVGNPTAACRGIQFMELLRPTKGCRVLGRYASGYFKGEPAITTHDLGKGKAVYQGCHFSEDAMRVFLLKVLAMAGITPNPDLPTGVEVLKRGTLRFYLNHNPKPAVVRPYANGTTLLGVLRGETVELPPFGVCIVDEKPWHLTAPEARATGKKH